MFFFYFSEKFRENAFIFTFSTLHPLFFGRIIIAFCLRMEKQVLDCKFKKKTQNSKKLGNSMVTF